MTTARLALTVAIFTIFPLSSRAQFPPAPGTGPGLPETIEAIDNARVTTRILYITAHPDDESAAVLTYLARGLHADVALLSLTRGEGGQNALGPEQAPQLGLIRTQELLAATRGYGVKLYFTRARDFGFSKTPQETEKVWDGQVLEDMVRLIRAFRPNIVINHWGGVHTGHGHHQASGLLTPKAVHMAADVSYNPSDPTGKLPVPVDEAPWNPQPPVLILNLDRSDSPKGYLLPLDDVDPLYGKSYREIGLDAFVSHHTQGIAGFLNSPFLRRPIALVPEDGSKFDPRSLALTLVSVASLKGPCACEQQLKQTDQLLESARASALKLDWPSAVSALVSAEKTWQSASVASARTGEPPDLAKAEFLSREKQKLDRALQLAAGLQFFADADRGEVVALEDFTVNISSRCRPEVKCGFSSPEFSYTQSIERMHPSSKSKEGSEKAAELSWVVTFGKTPGGPNVLGGQPCPPPRYLRPGLTPEPPPLMEVGREIHIDDFVFCPYVPVMHTTATSTTVVRVPLRLVPAYTLAVDPTQFVAVLNAPRKPFDVFLRVHSYSEKAAKVSAGLGVPDGFTTTAPVAVSFAGEGEQYTKFTVTPPGKLEAGNFTVTAYADCGGERFATTLEPLPSVPTILWAEPAQTVVHAFDINVPPHLHVGYISAEGEPIPDALRRLGIAVDMLDTNALEFLDLLHYDAIVVGVRAYELRPELAGANKRLLEYVSNGGTLIVQYNRDFIWDKLLPAPYPARIGTPTPRITDETAEVKFLKPGDPLLNHPNKITQADFQNWIQERGLYFWSDFDSRYTALLSMHDPGEKDLTGGLVYAKFGKGTYIYTGLAFFRELPEGIPGAYRLFVNLLCASNPR